MNRGLMTNAGLCNFTIGVFASNRGIEPGDVHTHLLRFERTQLSVQAK